jgi:hypothetical protein
MSGQSLVGGPGGEGDNPPRAVRFRDKSGDASAVRFGAPPTTTLLDVEIAHDVAIAKCKSMVALRGQSGYDRAFDEFVAANRAFRVALYAYREHTRLPVFTPPEDSHASI